MRPKGSKQELEIRRRTGIALLGQGLSGGEVARRLGVRRSSVSRWKQAFEAGGESALKAKPQSGGTSRLSGKQIAKLRGVLIRGARSAGYGTELWTLSRVAEVIDKHFGVSYTLAGVWYMLHRMGFTAQKPERQARERDGQAVLTWREQEWPRIKKGRVGQAER